MTAGETLGIIGANGSGKSTLLKILSRFTVPTRGSANVRGRIVSLLEVGTEFHPELSGRDNIFLNGALLGMRRADIAARFKEIVAFAEIGRFVDTRSSGIPAACTCGSHLRWPLIWNRTFFSSMRCLRSEISRSRKVSWHGE